jgi:hypothetical protein
MPGFNRLEMVAAGTEPFRRRICLRNQHGGFPIMSKSKLVAGAAIAVFALGAATGTAFAHHHAAKKATPVTYDSAPSMTCGKGKVPVLHSNGNGPTKWGCVKAS